MWRSRSVSVRTWRSRFAGHVISVLFSVFLFGAGLDSSRVSLPVSSGVGGGGVYILLFWCIL